MSLRSHQIHGLGAGRLDVAAGRIEVGVGRNDPPRPPYDRKQDRLGRAALVRGAVADGKALLVANFDDAAIAAGMSAADVMQEIAPIVGGGGGGKPGMARAGGKDPSKMAEAMARASELLRSAAA